MSRLWAWFSKWRLLIGQLSHRKSKTASSAVFEFQTLAVLSPILVPQRLLVSIPNLEGRLKNGGTRQFYEKQTAGQLKRFQHVNKVSTRRYSQAVYNLTLKIVNSTRQPYNSFVLSYMLLNYAHAHCLCSSHFPDSYLKR